MTVPKPPSYNEPVVFTNVSNELPRLPAEERLRVGSVGIDRLSILSIDTRYRLVSIDNPIDTNLPNPPYNLGAIPPGA